MRSVKSLLLAAKWGNSLQHISSVALWAWLSSGGLWSVAVYRSWGYSKQWRDAYFLIGWYYLTLFVSGILGGHFWWLFVPVRHCLTHTWKKPGNRPVRYVAARLPCSFIAGTPNSIEFQVDHHLQNNDPKFHGTDLCNPCKLLFWIFIADAEQYDVYLLRVFKLGAKILCVKLESNF